MEDKLNELFDRIDMLQSYVQFLGDRLDIMMRMLRTEKKTFQPPSMQSRRSKLLEVISKPEE